MTRHHISSLACLSLSLLIRSARLKSSLILLPLDVRRKRHRLAKVRGESVIARETESPEAICRAYDPDNGLIPKNRAREPLVL